MTSISTLGQTTDQIERLKVMQSNLALYQQQLASGKKTDLFKGLGTDVIFSERARADFGALDSFKGNIVSADRRIKLMMNAVKQMQQQARNVVNAIDIQVQQGEFEMDSVGDLASKALEFVFSLLNEKDGDRYLFGGAETRDAPVTDTGQLDTYLTTKIDDWIGTTIDNDELIDSYRDSAQLTDTLIGYSAPLSSGNAKSVYVRVDETTEIDFTVLANEQGFRDLIAGFAMLSDIAEQMDKVALAPGDDPLTTVTAPGVTEEEQSDNFYAIFNDVALMLTEAIDRMDTSMFNLSETQARISEIGDNHDLEKNTLLDTIGRVEDVDMNDTAVKLNALQLQLEVSYRVTAFMREFSLSNFL